MNISIKASELTDQERSQMTSFYKKVLQDGFAPWPLRGGRLVLWINQKARRVASHGEWHLTEEMLYIGHSYDSGASGLTDPAVRLAIITALMSLTGHTSDPTLMELVERQLATIMAGNYQTVVAPLGQRADGRPIEQMAWSTSDGLAARLGDEWVRPLTGEPVEVGAGWIVLDVESREAAPVVSDGRTLLEFAEDMGYLTQWLDDGRLAIGFFDESRTHNVYRAAIDFGCQNLVIESLGGGWCVTTTPQSEIPMPAVDEDTSF